MGGLLKRPAGAYLLAVAATAAMAAVRFALASAVGQVAPLIPFALAVFVTAWYGGLKPGLAATFLAALAANLLFTAPDHLSLTVDGAGELIALGVFLAAGVLISLLCESLHVARRRLESQAERLEREVLERQQAVREAQAARDQAEHRAREAERVREERRRAEAALEESERRLRAFMDNSPARVWLKDEQGRYALVSRSVLSAYQLGEEDLLGKTDHDVFPSAVADLFRQNDLEVLSSDRPAQFTELSQEPDGEHLLLSMKFPVRDAQGRRYVGGVAVDVTRERRALAEREQALAMLDGLVESAPLGICLLDRDMRFRMINGPLAEMNGLPVGEHLGRRVADILPDLLPHVEQLFRKVLTTGQVVADEIVEGETPKAPGVKRIWREGWFPVHGLDGEPWGVGVIVQEITAQRRAERQMADLLQRLTSLVDNTPLAVIEWDARFHISRWSGQAEKVFGYSSDEAIGMSLESCPFLAPGDQPTLRQRIEQLEDPRGKFVVFACRNRTKAGELLHCEWYNSVLHDEAGQMVAVLSLVLDVTQRRLAEETLRAERERAQMVADGVPALISYIDAQARYRLNNRAYETWFGRPRSEILGRHLQEVLGEGAWAAIRPRLEAALAGQTVSYEAEAPYRDGGARWISATYTPDIDQQGKVRGVVAHVVDITSRKRIEETLRFQHALTQSVTDNAATAIFMTDELGRCTFMNPAAERMIGCTIGQAQGKLLHDLVHRHQAAGDPQTQACFFERALAEHRVLEGHEDTFHRTSGGVFPAMVNAKPIRRQAATVGAVVEVRDITLEKKAAEAARQRTAQVWLLADVAARINGASGVNAVMQIVADEARNLIGAHQAVTSFTINQGWGQSINAVSLSDKYAAWRQFEAPPDGAGIYSLVCRQNKPIRLTREELESHPAFRRFGAYADRHPPLVGWLAAPLADRDGQNIGLVQVSDKLEGEFTQEDEAILVQLAAMASVAVENARLMENLRDADRRKDDFLATLAHELRNPLAPIRNAVQVLRAKGPPDPDLVWSRDIIERQVAQMARLLDDLLDVSRITRNKFNLRKSRITLAEVFDAALETSRPLIAAAGHRLSVSLPAETIALEADRLRLAQVFANLLNNAAKYTDPCGQIWLSAETQGETVVVKVRDSGIGIPAEMLPRMFVMFSQGDSALERSQGGLGIGLSLVKGLVEMHGGTVEAHSDGPGKGSEFVVRLPLAPEKTEAPQDDTPRGPTRAAGRKILVADDNRDAANTLAMMLRIMGNEVRTAFDGQMAIEVSEDFRPDVALLDIGMPRMNGHEAARRIREQPWGQEMLLVALTGWGQDEDRRRSREAGFDVHLVKPLDPAALQKLLAQQPPRPV